MQTTVRWQRTGRRLGAATLILLSAAALRGSASVSGARADEPETVMVTLRPKAGAEADLARVVAEHWTTARRLNLVHGAPHVTIRTKDGTGRPCFVDIFTWRDIDIPDNAPPEILTIWNAMNRLVEARSGRPGVEIVRVALVDPADKAHP